MKFTKPLAAVAAIAAAGSIGFLSAPIALADPGTQNLGTQGKLVDASGNISQGWTVSDLKVSTDTIPHPVYGTLWEATATDEALQGGVTPIVSNFNARAANGQTYRVLFGAATPQGVNPATLAEGQTTSGKIYFDVTGETPDSVVYNAGGVDLLVWVKAPAPSSGSSTGSTPGYSSGSAGTSSSTPAESTEAEEVKPEDDAAAEPAAAEDTPATEAPEGSQGTPLETGSQGTPLPEGTEAVPAGSQGTPIAEGTPLPAGTEGQPAAVEGAPVAEGAPAEGSTPVTTVVPAPGTPTP